MGDGFGFQPRIRLLDQKLHLDPEIERQIEQIEAETAAKRAIEQWRLADFRLLLAPHWDAILAAAPNPLTTPVPPRPGGPAFTPGKGPDTPKAADFSDVAGAIYKLPAVQRLVDRAQEEGMRQLRVLRGDWDRAGPGEKTLMVSFTTVVFGSMLTAVLANQPSRNAAFGLIRGKEIPVPGVGPLSFTVSPPVPGSADYGFTLKLDVMKLLRR